ncbi:MAG: hypothetical protein KBG28_18140 [Kofleriaceae bacterium]|jgi:hypothetical protein|nr:hypothetical protein [Kofleriaceae bacterium]MBP6836669.1 hypothetical protein [Kofleriaceae bacterium]MBP9205901.1 hypothetical protein [Kofleriaceae bacterium]
MSLDHALQRSLAIRLNLVGLSSMPVVEEWMDIHIDRWLEHVPMPPEMPDGHGVSYLATVGSDLRRLWCGAWGDPRGFVPKMADYFKLCNMAKSDERVLDQIGLTLEPQLVGSWIGVWAGKVFTGWHFWDPHAWDRFEPLFGTHEAKYKVKKFVEDHHIDQIERFTQAIGDDAFSELELRLPGDDVEAQVGAMDAAFVHFTGAPLRRELCDRLREAPVPTMTVNVRIRDGKIIKVGGQIAASGNAATEAFCVDAQVGCDGKLFAVCDKLGGAGRLEYVRAGEHAGVDVLIEPADRPSKPVAPAPAAN